MQEDLDRERKAIMKQWAKREEQIERVMSATVGMYGDLQGIAGKSLQEIEGMCTDVIADGEKFSLLVLPRMGLDDAITGLTLPGGLCLTRTLPLAIADHWQRWVGELRTKDIEGAGAYLLLSRHSQTPDVLDGDNQSLMQTVCQYWDAVMIVGTPFVSSCPKLLTGANVSGEIRIRQLSDLRIPVRRAYNQNAILRRLQSHDFDNAVVVSDNLSRIASGPGHVRLKRALSAFFTGIHDQRHDERLHQFCRCIDGIILSGKGSGRKDFNSRTALFIGSGHEVIADEIYQMRSAVEHLRPAESEAVACADLKAQRTRVLTRSVQAEMIARHCMRRILMTDNLLCQFKDDTYIGQFWTQSDSDRRSAWGDSIDFNNQLESAVDMQFVDNSDLGLPD